MIQVHQHDLDSGRVIHEIRLARPPVNALDPTLLDALREAVVAAADGGAGGIVLAGGPTVFSAGLDVPHLLRLERIALGAAWGAFFNAARAIAQSPVPVVAAINGHSPAGGCVLALCCDYRVMARAPDPAKPYRIGLNEVQVGLAVPDAIQHLLRRVVGVYRSERLLVSGSMIDADAAQAIGLVDELAEPDAVAPRARQWLQQLLALPSAPMLATRRLARADLVEALADSARIDIEGFLDGWYSAQTQDALKALVARLKNT